MKARQKPNTNHLSFALRFLLPYLSPHKFSIFISSTLGLFSSVASLCIPLTIKEISKLIIVATRPDGTWNFDAIKMWGSITLALLLTAFIFCVMQTYIVYGVTSKIGNKIRSDLSQKNDLLPISYFDNHDIGEILSYIINDTNLLSSSLDIILFNLYSTTITLFGSVIILFLFHWAIGLSVLLSLPLALAVVSFVGKKIVNRFCDEQLLISNITIKSEEDYDAQILIKSFNATERYQKKFDIVNEKLRKTSIIAEFLNESFSPILNFFGNFIFTIICLLSGYLIGMYGGSPDDIATIVAAVSYGAQLIAPLLAFAQIFSNSGRIVASSKRLSSFLNEKEEIDETNKTLKIKKIEGKVTFNNVNFGYKNKKNVIVNFSEKVLKGQKIAIVGHTGAGKTTLINLLMRFYDVNSGSIEIDGINTRDMNRKYVRSLFGMVLQDTWVFEGTFMENIKFANKKITDETVYKICKATHCDQFIKQMGGYNKKISNKTGLSLGQIQLLNIARAMAQNAPFLILDEATSNVDVYTETLIQEALDKLMKGKTSFIIAHRLSTIRNADLILVMKDGKIVETGRHAELLSKNGLYAELYYAQFCL
ncbi:MAG: ABC transporter ATP-binding protein/permease [Bacilli bacterium]|nr:ABC transporter ATP-binding protein/permease [Bacilli bacterium]